MEKHYWGKETDAARENFPFSNGKFPMELIYAIAEIKEAATKANVALGFIDRARAKAIVAAAEEIRKGKHDKEFPLPALQGGAGTSLNMNVNEVIASRATELLLASKKKISVHPLDHVNRGQSTNDVNPSALKIASARMAKKLLRTVDETVRVFKRKAKEFNDIKKLGRTHLQDAVPVTLGAEFLSFAATVERDGRRIAEVIPYLYELNLGGTAVGTSVNAPPKFRALMYAHLSRIARLPLVPAKNLMSQTSSQTDFVMLAHAVLALAADMSKIANDLRLMASGPRGGFGEIRLASLQNGSSIMPGKVNPVLLEALNQLYFVVSGNCHTILEASHASQLELGVMWPTIADRLLQSLILAQEALAQANARCFATIEADKKRCRELLERSSAYAAYLIPKLGYDAVAALVKESLRRDITLRELALQKKLLTNKEFDALTGI